MTFKLLSRSATTAAAVALLTACAQNATPVSGPLPPAAGSALTHSASHPLASVSATRPLATRTHIYIYASYDLSNTINVIKAGATRKVVDTITQGLNFPLGIAIDKAGTLYVANNGNATVTEYPAGSNTPSVTLTQGLLFPNYVAIDRSRNLWVSNGKNVLEFPPGATSPSLTLTNGINGAGGVAVDSQGTVYVSNLPSSGSPYVAVYPAGATSPKTTFGQNDGPNSLVYPIGITLDLNQNIYVADFFNGQINVYSHKNYKFLRYVIGQPYFMEPGGVTIDVRNRLYAGGGGNSSSANLIQFPDLGKGSPTVFYEQGGLYGVAADPWIGP